MFIARVTMEVDFVKMNVCVFHEFHGRQCWTRLISIALAILSSQRISSEKDPHRFNYEYPAHHKSRLESPCNPVRGDLAYRCSLAGESTIIRPIPSLRSASELLVAQRGAGCKGRKENRREMDDKA